MSGILGWEQSVLWGNQGSWPTLGTWLVRVWGGGELLPQPCERFGAEVLVKVWIFFFFTDESEIPLCSRLNTVSLRSTFLAPLWDPGHAAQGGSYGLCSDELPLLA